jgi:hypothetical protein
MKIPVAVLDRLGVKPYYAVSQPPRNAVRQVIGVAS